MKRFVFAMLFVWLSFMLVGCNNLNTDLPDDPTLTKVVIPLPKSSNARAIGLDSTKELTNYFEVFFRRTDGETNIYYSVSATIEEGQIEINIPAGTYDILLLAGNYTTVLASGYVIDEEIVLGQVNQITMVLDTFDVDLNVPNTVEVGSSFNVDLEINTKNPFIDLLSSPLRLRYSYPSEMDPYLYYLDVVSSENNIFKYRCSITAPLVPTELEDAVGLYERCYIIPFGQDIFSNWYIASASNNYYNESINFVSGQGMPEVEINITWIDEE